MKIINFAVTETQNVFDIPHAFNGTPVLKAGDGITFSGGKLTANITTPTKFNLFENGEVVVSGWVYPFDGYQGEIGTSGGGSGAAGANGKDGKDGAKGDKGETGENGKSAYELAQQNGFSGSLTEWLASLKGDKGEAGERGEKGQDGLNGVDGIVERENNNLFATANNIRTNASISTKNRFESNSRFVITATMGEWIRTPALDSLTGGVQTGQTYTFSALTDKKVTELKFYFNAETMYLNTTRQVAGDYYLYTASFSLKNNVLPQVHFNLTANNGEILQVKLEQGSESTLLTAARKLELRLGVVESKVQTIQAAQGSINVKYISRAELMALNSVTSIGNATQLTIPFDEPFSKPPFVNAVMDATGNYILYISNVSTTGFNIATSYGAGLNGIWYYTIPVA